jgi:Domain of unknown function (DUF1929)
MPWEIVANDSQILAIHAALLPTNQVLMFGGSEHNRTQNLSGNPADLDNSRLFNLNGGGPLIETIGSPTTDVFCSGHALLADGRLLVVGGTAEWGGEHADHDHDLNFIGERSCWSYHPRARRWRPARDLNVEPGTSDGGGRWYPNVVTLANGEALAVAGHPSETDSRHNNDTPERYSPGSDSWAILTAERLDVGVRSRYYPRFHLLTDGNVFFVSPLGGSCRVWNPFTGTTVSTVPAAGGARYNSSWDFPSVLLPLLPQNGYDAHVLVCGDVDTKKVDLSVTSPTWVNTSARQGAAAGKERRFACAVILPTGQVFISGGIDGGRSDSDAVREGEIYDAGIDWNTGQYSNPDSWQTVEAADVVRNYHSTALLLPNGRVWTAGSSKNADQGPPSSVGEMRIEVYKPAYDADPNRPQLTQAPASVGYNQDFEISSPQAAQIGRVAITRCGSVTHAFDGDQRYVGLAFTHVEGELMRVTSPPNSRIAPSGYYLLWVVDADGRPCQQARFIRICAQRLFIITDRSTFSTHEVQALGTPAQFANALYVTLDGFLPNEVGEPPVTPVLAFTRPDGSAVPGMSAELNRVLYEDDTVPPDIAQRVMFVFNIRFTSLQAFNEIPAADAFQTVTLTARHGGNAEQAPLALSKNPNPYMRDGAVHWLSTDLRTFRVRPGLTRAGVTLGSAPEAPVTFIQQLLERFNITPTDEDHPFFDISEDAEESKLELASQVAGQPVHNFAVAKVRYRAPSGIDATDARVFFRLFTTAATGFVYNASAYPRQGDGAGAAPLLGLAGGEILSIPFFAEARQTDMRNQVDSPNRKTIAGGGAVEVTTYFGCWLDFNQPTPRFPLNPPHNGDGGPFSGPLLSIQQLVRNNHCCLVAEIHYPPDPIPTGATPGSHDNLSQRNLVVVESQNPGDPATHTVQSTFEIKPSPITLDVPEVFGVPPDEQVEIAAVAPNRERDVARVRKELAAVAPGDRLDEAPLPPKRRVESDELLIRWNNLPRESRVRLFVPDVNVRQIVAAAAARNGPPVVTALDDETLLCKVGDVAYVPIPGPRQLNIPGLISIELPATVTHSQSFTVTVHQVAGRPRKIIGSFQLTIPVRSAAEILPNEIRKLAVFRHVARAIPFGNRWHPVWQRYLGEIEDRVRGLGGDPEAVRPSPTGEGPARPTAPEGVTVLTGRVARILYDCFGDFEGFVLDTCESDHMFRTRYRGIERLALKACRFDLRLTVWFTEGRPEEIQRLVLLC